MNSLHYLSRQNPIATPITFEFEGKEWSLWPLDHPTVAMELEGWVVRHVARKVEMLKPSDDDKDPAAWAIYNRRSQECQLNIERGMYGAFSAGWQSVIRFPDTYGRDGFAEAIFQCVRFKCPAWTWEHTVRLMNSPTDYDAMYWRFEGFNFPKVLTQESRPPPGAQENQSSQSDGTKSSDTP